MILGIIGADCFSNYQLFENRLLFYFTFDKKGDNSVVNSIKCGGGSSTKQYTEEFSEKYNIDVDYYRPEYDKYEKKRALIVLNELVVLASDVLITFWDGECKRTRNAILIARKVMKETVIIYI